MRDFSNPRVYILSAHKSGATNQVNEVAAAELVCDLALEGFPFQECLGYYEGQCERSVLVTGQHAGDTVQRLAEAYGQDTFLLVAEHDRAAYLVDVDTGFHKHLGKLVCVGDQIPIDNDDPWTCVDGTYFQTLVNGPLVDLKAGL